MITVTDNSVKAINAALIANNEAIKKEVAQTVQSDLDNVIDDNATSLDKTWSSTKIDSEIKSAVAIPSNYDLHGVRATGFFTSNSRSLQFFVPLSTIRAGQQITIDEAEFIVRISDGGYTDNNTSTPVIKTSNSNYTFDIGLIVPYSGFNIHVTKNVQFYKNNTTTPVVNNSPAETQCSVLKISIS